MLTICLSLFNPNIKYFKELIDSLCSIQSTFQLEVYIRNDGSTTSLLEHENYANRHLKNLKWKDGMNIGVNESFISLLKEVKTKYVAFCDQDDIWHKEKLTSAIELLEFAKKKVYCSNLQLMSSNSERMSQLFFRSGQKDFSPLYRNYVVGCTTVFHIEYAQKLIQVQKSTPNTYHLFDQKLGVIAFENSDLIFDPNYYISYRIHENNVIGKKNQGIISRVLRVRNFIKLYREDQRLLEALGMRLSITKWLTNKIKAHLKEN